VCPLGIPVHSELVLNCIVIFNSHILIVTHFVWLKLKIFDHAGLKIKTELFIINQYVIFLYLKYVKVMFNYGFYTRSSTKNKKKILYNIMLRINNFMLSFKFLWDYTEKLCVHSNKLVLLDEKCKPRETRLSWMGLSPGEFAKCICYSKRCVG